ncbi:MAG: hypothetical protein IKV51_07690 [Clostridia bacterium]|nr:hypothetical protein [Clostridia bacterium]
MPAAYRTVALLMRYPLAALGVLIALRGAYMALVDLRRAARIRRQEGRDSAVAVLFCLPSDREGKGKRVPLTRSGCVGSSGSADVSVKDCGLKARHFEYDIHDGMMEVRPLPGAKVSRVKPGDGALKVEPGEKLLAGNAVIYFKLIRRAAKPVSPGYRRVYKRKGGK